MFNYSSLDNSPPRRYKRHANRKRNGYELTSQRDMLPIALGAGLASVLVYCLLYYYAPTIFAFEMRVINDPPDVVVRDYEPIVVKEEVQEEYVEPEQTDEPPPPMDPEETIVQEPVELDILDIQVSELVMAPGETDLSVPEPTTREDAPSPASIMQPAELKLSNLALPGISPEQLQMPEPTPVNANEVIAHATPQLTGIDESDRILETELKKAAQEGAGDSLPSDSRTLSELIGEKNLGAGSGVARLGSDVLFGFNECKLKNTARITMQYLAALIQKNPDTIFIIEGHTDSIGGDTYNALLSLQRAAAVREWLRLNRIPTKNVYIRPCADNSPLKPTDGDREAQALNRRVEIHMRKPTEAMPPGCENHNYKVDLEKKLSVQLAAGVHIPKTYPAASQNNGVPTAETDTPAKPANNKNKPQKNTGGKKRK